MVLPTVLKGKHSLRGIRLTPLFKRTRNGKPESLKEYARVSRDLKTDDLNLEEIAQHVKNITGEELDEIGLLAGKNTQIIWTKGDGVSMR